MADETEQVVKVKLAVLDDDSCLIGYKEVLPSEVELRDIVVPNECDLPTNATYKWMPEDETGPGRFMPLGHGVPLKNRTPAVDPEYAVFQMMKYLAEKEGQAFADACPTVISYVEWYDHNLSRRTEERMARIRRGRSMEQQFLVTRNS